MSIRELRYNNNLTLNQLAVELDIELRRIRILDRKLDNPTVEELTTISKYFKIGYNELFKNGNEQKNLIGEGYVTAKSESVLINPPIKKLIVDDKIPVLDLFCGIGGLSYGFEQTNRFVTVAGIDLMEDRINTFQLNHPHAIGIKADIRKFPPKILDDLLENNPKVIVGGAPCQGFSSIRPFRTLSEDDQRNSLFTHFGQYVNYFQPEWFVFENVVGLLTHKKGKTLKVLTDEFEKLGYKLSFRVLNSAYYGVPQMRERLIIVGNNIGREFEWPEPTHFLDSFKSMAGSQKKYVLEPKNKSKCSKAVNVIDAIDDLSEINAGESSEIYSTEPKNIYQEYLRKNSNGLKNHTASSHSEKMMNIIKQSGYNIKAVEHLVTSGFSSCYSRLESHKPSVTLTVNFTSPSSNKCIHPIQNRALTPREGARIQGFPDNFSFAGSRTQIVKQIGNAVPPILSKKIADSLINYFE